MASPNPEGEKDNQFAGNERSRSEHKQYARPTTGLYNNPRQPAYIPPDSEEHRATERDYWKRQVRWQAVGAIATILAFVAAAVYAHHAKRQTHWAHVTAQQAVQANIVARQALVIDQSAHVGLGDREGKIGEFVPNTYPHRVRLRFFNSGHSAATVFGLQVVKAGQNWKPTWNRRWKTVGPHGEPHGWSGMTVGSATIGPESLHFEYGPEFNDAELAKAPKQFITMMGVFQYCDQFGVYHCETFGVSYLPPPINDFVPRSELSLCPQSQMSEPNTDWRGPIVSGEQWTDVPIRRCKQPNEKDY